MKKHKQNEQRKLAPKSRGYYERNRDQEVSYGYETQMLVGRQRCGGGYRIHRKKIGSI